MSQQGESVKFTPPYVPYKTLETYLEELLASGVPPYIDRSTMPTKSGGTQGQLISALKALNLIDRSEGKVNPLLDSLVKSEGEQRKVIWREIIIKAYPFLFSGDDFDLTATTSLRFRKKFEEQNISGSTLQRCLAFFIRAANAADIEMSAYVKDLAKRKRSTNGKSNGKSKQSKSKKQPEKEPEVQQDTVSTNKATENSTESQPSLKAKIIEKMTDKFPAYDPNWDPDVQAKWFEAFSNFNKQILDLDTHEK